MEGNENYEELKWTAKTVIQFITSDKLYYVLFLLAVMFILVKAIEIVFRPLVKKKARSVQMSFLQGCLQVLVVVTIGIKIGSLSETLSGFGSQILMSSSLLVVVFGFVFQEGLSNIVHGFIISIFTPFRLGDRVHVTIDGESITGYIQSIDLRHTVIQNVMNSSHVIVPNSKMDLCVIDNNYFDGDSLSSNFLDVSVTYESDLEKAMSVMAEMIERHPLVAGAREKKKITEPVTVLVRDLADSGICLRAAVTTMTVEENFTACSDLRRDLVLAFKDDPDLEIAYPHMELVEPKVLRQPSKKGAAAEDTAHAEEHP
ncbi:MAG: mechanosensitive ion channel family protein [Lachnospiraceae bacterium]|nr:mechanosensitive ion channel family protein [Lachnospiraceae bacterium]